MAYLHKDDIVLLKFRGGLSHSRVVDVRFRRFLRSWRDKKTDKIKKRWKSVPYAICETFAGVLPAGTEFMIPGYKLKNETKDGERLLVLHNKFACEFDTEWANTLIAESKEKRGTV